MSVLWDREALIRATDGKAHGDWSAISGVSIDTRTLRQGDLFVALKDVRDGHDFVAQAQNAGAGAALVSRLPDDARDDARLLMVDNPLFALENIGSASRTRATDAKVIAVTGSAGKTSVKDALRAVLSDQGQTHAAEKSYNNHWGVPLTLARMPAQTRFGVFEIGMNHSGEIAPLTRLVRPHVAVITNVLPVHLGNFDSEADIASAKAEILEGLRPDGHAILNRDNPWFELLATRATSLGVTVISFGSHAAATCRLLKHKQNPTSASVEADIMGEQVLFKLNAPARHQAINALAVLAAAKLVGADLAKAALSLGRWKPGDGRGAHKSIRIEAIDPASAFTLIDESYNANPASMVAALETLRLAEPGDGAHGRAGRRIAVLGDMLELGETSAERHTQIAEAADMAHVDQVFACGPHSRLLYDALPKAKRGAWAENSAALASEVRSEVKPGDVVMVKGSLGSRMATIVETLMQISHGKKR